MSVLVRLPGAGAMIVDVFHKVGESSFIYRERQSFSRLCDYPGLNRKPMATIGDLQRGHLKAGRPRNGAS